jgi:hypothetical protein
MSNDVRVFSYSGAPELMKTFIKHSLKFDRFDSPWVKKVNYFKAKVADWPTTRRMAFLMALDNVRKFSVTLLADASLMDKVAHDTVLLVQYMELELWTDCAEQVRALCPQKRKRAKTTGSSTPAEDN